MSETELRALFVGGPTASGKSSLVMRLAEHLPVEIISADSVQIYQGFDIGSATPSRAELEAVPHHLVDHVDPETRYSAARFAEDARARIAQVLERGGLPGVVGVTGLYLRSLLFGLYEGPPADAGVRAALTERAEAEGVHALHEALTRVDPVSARRLHANDVRRVIRALEVHELTGRPLSEFHAEHGLRAREVAGPLWCLRWERDTLRARIRARCEAMLSGGWIDEVRALLDAGVPPAAPAFEAVGYREVLQHVSGELDRSALPEKVAVSTWRLAKRQMNWFRGQPDVRWIDGESADAEWPELLAAASSLWAMWQRPKASADLLKERDVSVETPGPDWVLRLKPYVPGKPSSEVKREPASSASSLASNENPPVRARGGRGDARPPVRSTSTRTRHLRAPRRARRTLRRRGRPDHRRERLEQLITLLRAPSARPSTTSYSQYAFIAYKIVNGGRRAPARGAGAGAEPDVDAMIAACDADTRLLFLANPNNPTGTWTPRADVERLLAEVPRTCSSSSTTRTPSTWTRPTSSSLDLQVSERTSRDPHLLQSLRPGRHPHRVGLRRYVVDRVNRIREP